MAKKKPYGTYLAPNAVIDPTARIGKGTRIWAFCQVAEHAVIGKDCVLANGVYVDRYVEVGNRVRIHNKALLYHGVIVEDDVFIGPGACFTNDPWPRSGLTRDLKGKSWTVHRGASIGANATVLPDISIGAYAVIGAGSVVTRPVRPHALVYGNPARERGLVCRCGQVMKDYPVELSKNKIICAKCKKVLKTV
ncbi:MAG: acyltransferase [Candidatus Omnitrophica bacterium]|nr:acyltransferase [Candidatus Omnitrophota bacterium]MDD5671054.1 acyltransferase [Candidatus Omnitrophota bacterium]